MDGQVLGGGVIVVVAVVLWLVYLLPSLQSRQQHGASERNAVRLNQTLRVLAETSETPDEVRLELNARTVHAQQRIAKRAQEQREAIARQIQKEQEQTALTEARRELAEARLRSGSGRARARRVTRLVATTLAVGGLAAGVTGGFQLVMTGAVVLLVAGVVALSAGVSVLAQLARVAVRAHGQAEARPTARSTRSVQDVVLPTAARTWTPRELPRPLATSAGSRASATLAAVEARDARRQAAIDEAIRERAEQEQPPTIQAARAAAEESRFARMGYVDDAEIEANVRRLLERRAAGQ